jgi:hypothetical protein
MRKVVIIVDGGNIQGVFSDAKFGELDITLIDHDNMEAEGIMRDDRDSIGEEAIQGLKEHGMNGHEDFIKPGMRPEEENEKTAN